MLPRMKLSTPAKSAPRVGTIQACEATAMTCLNSAVPPMMALKMA